MAFWVHRASRSARPVRDAAARSPPDRPVQGILTRPWARKYPAGFVPARRISSSRSIFLAVVQPSFAQRHDLGRAPPLRLLSLKVSAISSSNSAGGSPMRLALGLLALVQFDQQALDRRIVELQHQPVERRASRRRPTAGSTFRKSAGTAGRATARRRSAPRPPANAPGCRGAVPAARARRDRAARPAARRPAASPRLRRRRRACRAWRAQRGQPAADLGLVARGTWPPAAAGSSLRASGRSRVVSCRSRGALATIATSRSRAWLAAWTSRSRSMPRVAVRKACSRASTASSASSSAKASAPALVEEVARVELFGQGEDAQIDLLGDEQFQHLVGPLLPGLVAVEHQHDPVGEPLQDADVPLAQGRAQHGHRVGEAELMGHDAVGVAFHDHGGAALADRPPGPRPGRRAGALGEQRRFRRIDVLGRAAVGQLRQHPPAQPDRPALGVADRKQHPAAEAVVEAAAAGRPGQHADGLQHPCARPRLPPARLQDPVAHPSGEKPRWNCSMLSAVMPRSLEISSGRLGLGRFAAGTRDTASRPRPSPGRASACRSAGCRRLRRPGVRGAASQGDARPIGQHGQGLGELDAFHLHDEAEDVAADVADPALERLPLGVDLEAGARVVVPGAEADVVAALAAELDVRCPPDRRCRSPAGPVLWRPSDDPNDTVNSRVAARANSISRAILVKPRMGGRRGDKSVCRRSPATFNGGMVIIARSEKTVNRAARGGWNNEVGKPQYGPRQNFSTTEAPGT